MIGFFHALNSLLHSPQKVIAVCLVLILLNLVVDGSLLRWWSLHRDYNQIQEKIQTLQQQNAKLKMQLQKAEDPAFLEREARDRFDLVSEGDLVFVFSEEEGT